MLKPYRDPYGYKKLLAYQKAEELQKYCGEITQFFPKTKTLLQLDDQMNRSARSGKQNLVEGWRRNTTKEYYDFLGFSIGAIAEPEEDCDDIWKGIYFDLRGIKGLMGEKGIMSETKGEIEMGEKGMEGEMKGKIWTGEKEIKMDAERECKGLMGEKGIPLNPLNPLIPFDIDKLKFYPLDKSLPPIVQLKLRCKELNFLLHQIQNSLLSKMDEEKTLPTKDKFKLATSQKINQNKIENELFEQFGLQKLENGQVVDKDEI